MTPVEHLYQFPAGFHTMLILSYADLDDGKLDKIAGVYYEQKTPEGKRYGAGGVLAVEVGE